jgi:hypothetical protein
MLPIAPFFAAVPTLPIQETHLIAWKPQVDQARKYLLEAKVLGGPPVEVSLVTESKVTQVQDGIVTSEEKLVSLKVLLNGQPLPDSMTGAADAAGSRVVKRKLNGAFAEPLGTGPEAGMEMPAMVRINTFIYPQDPMAVGASWTVEHPADAKLQLPSGRTKYTFAGIDPWGSRRGFRIEFAYSDLAGSAPMGASGKIWLDTVDGELLEAQTSFTNASLSPMMPPGSFTTVLRRMAS